MIGMAIVSDSVALGELVRASEGVSSLLRNNLPASQGWAFGSDSP